MTPKQKLIAALKEASNLCIDNIDNTNDVDLHQMYEDLNIMINQLHDILDFEEDN